MAELTEKQELAALLLASGSTVAEAAEGAGAGERTLHTWRKLASFKARVSELRNDLFAEASGRLSALAGRAADKLGDLLDSPLDVVSLSAAKAILDIGMRTRQVMDLGERLRQIEDSLNNDERPPWQTGAG